MKNEKTDIVIRLIQNELSNSEKQLVYEQMDTDDELRALYYEYKNTFVKLGGKRVLSADEKNSDYKSIWKSINKKSGQKSIAIFYRYAAVLIIALGLGGVGGYLLNDRATEISTENQVFTFASGPKSQSDVVLPDGSQLTLNAKTSLTYQLDEQSNERLVTLKGEAYFNVIHNDDSPFIIEFDEVKIVDLGTIFNVKALPQQQYIETSLIEGEVEIIKHDGAVTSLKPGQKAVFNVSSHKIQIEEIKQDDVVAWLNNRFVFKNASLESIINELAQWYSVDIIWNNSASKTIQLHFHMDKTKSLETVMEMIQLNTSINYEIKKEEGIVKQIVVN